MAVADHALLNRLRCVLEYFGFGYRIAPYPIRRQARPWTIGQVPGVEGLHTAPPDYVGVGAQKCGTSWWASLIEQHPDVSPNRFQRKETHYLTHFLERPLTDEEIKAYHAAFARPEGHLCGEWTPNYLAHSFSALRILETAPEARILVLVRNPVDRYESGFNHESKMRYGAMMAPSVRSRVIRRYALRGESIWNGMYGAQLEILASIVPQDRILLLQYEACRDNPVSYLKETYRFLGLDDEFTPDGTGNRVNVQKRVVQPLDKEARSALTEMYRSDVDRLTALFPGRIDRVLWPEFCVSG